MKRAARAPSVGGAGGITRVRDGASSRVVLATVGRSPNPTAGTAAWASQFAEVREECNRQQRYLTIKSAGRSERHPIIQIDTMLVAFGVGDAHLLTQ